MVEVNEKIEAEHGRGTSGEGHFLRVPRIAVAQWALVAILLLLYSVSALDRIVISMVVDPIRKDFGITDVQMSFLIGMGFVVSYSLCGIPMGWLADRFPRRWVVYGGVMLWGFATAACGLAMSYFQLFAARLMVGAGEAALTPSAHSMISDAFPRRKLGLAISVYALGAIAGEGMSLIFGGLIVGHFERLPPTHFAGLQFQAWQLVFLAAGAPAVVLGVCIFLVREPVRTLHVRRFDHVAPATMSGFLRKHWRLWLAFTLVFGVMSIANGALLFWQPTYFRRYFHWSASEYGPVLGLVSTSGGLAGMLFSGWWVDRLYARGVNDAHFRYYIYALVVSTPLVVFALISRNVWIYIGFIWFAKALLVNFLGFSSAAVQLTTPPELRGQMSALLTAVIISLFGAGLGPVVPAVILQFLIRDEIQVGQALALTVVGCSVIAVLGAWTGLKPLRDAVQSQDGAAANAAE